MECTEMVDGWRTSVVLNGEFLGEVEWLKYLGLHAAANGEIDVQLAKYREE